MAFQRCLSLFPQNNKRYYNVLPTGMQEYRVHERTTWHPSWQSLQLLVTEADQSPASLFSHDDKRSKWGQSKPSCLQNIEVLGERKRGTRSESDGNGENMECFFSRILYLKMRWRAKREKCSLNPLSFDRMYMFLLRHQMTSEDSFDSLMFPKVQGRGEERKEGIKGMYERENTWTS